MDRRRSCGEELPIAHPLAHMHACPGDFGRARSLADRRREIAAGQALDLYRQNRNPVGMKTAEACLAG
jgi:hypothetical protein